MEEYNFYTTNLTLMNAKCVKLIKLYRYIVNIDYARWIKS